MALPPSTANWHWKNKNVTRWGTEWFERELVTISVTGDKEGEVVSIASVKEVDGDVELGQRKSKLITIFDCKVVLNWEGKTADGQDVKGSVTVPEVSHEVVLDGLSDFVYEWRCSTARSAEVDSVFALAKSRLPAALEKKFAEFPSAIINTHGKDLTVSADPSRSATPIAGNAAPKPAAAPGASGSAPVQPKNTVGKPRNTTTVTVNATFQAAADDLFGLLTDEKRIPIWTRASAKSIPTPGGEYTLFSGGVKGKYVTLSPGKEIVQTWSLSSPTWPSGHEGTLTTTFDQSSDSTTLTLTLAGVPTGTEEEIRRNLEGYYIHGFKSIGYVQLYLSEPVPSSSQKSKRTVSPKPPQASSSYIPAVAIACLVLVAAFSIPLFSSSPSSK